MIINLKIYIEQVKFVLPQTSTIVRPKIDLCTQTYGVLVMGQFLI